MPTEKRAMNAHMAMTITPLSFSCGETAAIRRRQRQRPPVDMRRRGRLCLYVEGGGGTIKGGGDYI